MELQIAGTNMELTPAIHSYVERKLGKLDLHLPTIIETKVEISEEQTRSPQQRCLVRVTVNSGVGGAVFHGEERGEEPFEAIDKVADIMTRRLESHKGKLYAKGRGSSFTRSKYNRSTKPAAPVRKIVKNKRFKLESTSVEEAIEQMEKLGHSFFLYLDDDTEEIRLLYRRNDGDYGLIVPQV